MNYAGYMNGMLYLYRPKIYEFLLQFQFMIETKCYQINVIAKRYQVSFLIMLLGILKCRCNMLVYNVAVKRNEMNLTVAMYIPI